MYGKKRYRALSKPAAPPVPPQEVVNSQVFVCAHCKTIKSVNTPYIEISALEKGKLSMYTKVCEVCTVQLKAWLNK